MISLEKWIILTPLQKLPNNVCNLGRIIVATGFEWLPKVQNIAQSGHTDWWGDWRPCLTSKKAKMPGTVFQLHNNSKVHDAPKSTVILCLYRTGSVSDVGTHNGKKMSLGMLIEKSNGLGQWLLLSGWLSGHFWQQKSTVRIQSSGYFICTIHCI